MFLKTVKHVLNLLASDESSSLLTYCDVGASGGLDSRWAQVKDRIYLVAFEPDLESYENLLECSKDGESASFYNTALLDQPGCKVLNLTRKSQLSSVYKPDMQFIRRFPDPDRYEVTSTAEVEVHTLDQLLTSGQIPRSVDFIKLDAQGAEYDILRGAQGTLTHQVLGIELEAELNPTYQNQPLFAQIDDYLRGFGFRLFDLKRYFWKRQALYVRSAELDTRAVAQLKGQIIFVDALYLLDPAYLPVERGLSPKQALKLVAIALLYGYPDFALEQLQAMTHMGLIDEARALRIQQSVLAQLAATESARAAGSLARGILRRLPGRNHVARLFHWLYRVCSPDVSMPSFTAYSSDQLLGGCKRLEHDEGRDRRG